MGRPRIGDEVLTAAERQRRRRARIARGEPARVPKGRPSRQMEFGSLVVGPDGEVLWVPDEHQPEFY